MKIVTTEFAAGLIPDNAMLIPGGFGSCGHPDKLTEAIEKRYLLTGKPEKLSLLFASGAGDKGDRGLNKLAHKGLVTKAIGGFWGLCPKLVKLVEMGELEGHNWPQGVISNLFREIASGSPGVLSRVGINTFIDPRIEGGVISKGKTLLTVETFRGREYLLYPSQQVDFALLRGSYCDLRGNIVMSDEAAFHDACAQAQAVKTCGGIVIVQVMGILENIPPHSVRIPGFLVDYVVLDEGIHPQTYGHSPADRIVSEKIDTFKRIIANRAIKEFPKEKNGLVVNLGIGIPALIGRLIPDGSDATLSIESGVIGGNPLYELSFGASENPEAIMEQASLFNHYDGGGIDTAFLGFAEFDALGCFNASKFGNKITGSGGFINIVQSARRLIFCGSLMTGGLEVEVAEGLLYIKKEGAICKFVEKVKQITFDRKSLDTINALEVLIITERAVFQVTPDGVLILKEIARGINIDELIKLIPFPFSICKKLLIMDINSNFEE